MQDLGWLLSQLKVTVMASDWFNFGVYLGVPYAQLKIYQANNQDVTNCLRETLAYWLSKNPSTEKLVKAINRTGEKWLAQTLQKSLSLGDHRKGISTIICIIKINVEMWNGREQLNFPLTAGNLHYCY